MAKRKLGILPPREPQTRAFIVVSRSTHTRLKQEAAEKRRPIMELADLLINRGLDDYELVSSAR